MTIGEFFSAVGFLIILCCFVLVRLDLFKIKKRLGMIGNINGEIFEKEEEEITFVVGKPKSAEELAKEISSSIKKGV